MNEYVFRTETPIKCCGECPCFHAENLMYCQVDNNIKMTYPYAKRMENCPLKELPTHGRLIDADTVADYFFNYLRVCSSLMNMKKTREMVNTVNEACMIAPTVLEA